MSAVTAGFCCGGWAIKKHSFKESHRKENTQRLWPRKNEVCVSLILDF
jgi:hypothetical protein